jgi:Tol biopolymer transport system component
LRGRAVRAGPEDVEVTTPEEFFAAARRRRFVTAVAVAATVTGAGVSLVPAGAYDRPGFFTRVSVTSSGGQGSFSGLQIGDCVVVRDTNPCVGSISANGRYVVFSSAADNLVPDDRNHAPDVFLHDRQTGKTELVDVALTGGTPIAVGKPTSPRSAGSFQPSVSADGRYVAYASNSPAIVTGDTNVDFDIFVRDRKTGTTERITNGLNGLQPLGDSTAPVISADGRYVAYDSDAPNLVPGDTNLVSDVFEYDRVSKHTVRVSVGLQGAQADDSSEEPSINADGRYVVFTSRATNLVTGDANSTTDVFVHDLKTGRVEAASVRSGEKAPPNDFRFTPSQSSAHAISADGRYVIFYSENGSFVPHDSDTSGSVYDAFVHDRKTGRTERVSVASSGAELNVGGKPVTYSEAIYAAMSPDGRYVAFYQEQAPFPLADPNEYAVVHDRVTGSTETISYIGQSSATPPPCTTDGQGASAGDPHMSFSNGGRYFAFSSCSGSIVKGDTNDEWDVFVRDRGLALATDDLASTAKLTVTGAPAFRTAHMVAATGAGTELTSASLTYRPASRDLLCRIDVASMPTFALVSPATVYAMGLTVGGVRYQVRAAKSGVDASYGLFRWSTYGWQQVATLQGGYGTIGPSVLVDVPLSAMGADRGGTLSDVAATVGIGSWAAGVVRATDVLPIVAGD